MKTWKQSVFFGMAAIIAIGFAFVGCDDGNGKNEEQPEFREVIINLTTFNNPYTATVQGTLLEAEWNGVASKIEIAIQGAYDNGEIMTPIFINGIVYDGLTIVVEKTSAYSKYKFEAAAGVFSRTLYLNYGFLKSATNTALQAVITDIAEAMFDYIATSE